MIIYKKTQKSAPYMERVSTAAVPKAPNRRKRLVAASKKHMHTVSEQVQAALTEARRAKGLLDEEYYIAAKEELEQLFDAEQYVDDQFKGLNLEELQAYLLQSLKLSQVTSATGTDYVLPIYQTINKDTNASEVRGDNG